MSFRAALGAVPGPPSANPWKNMRNWNGGVGPGSPGLAWGQVGARRAKIEGLGPRGSQGQRPSPRASGAGFGFADVNHVSLISY